MYNYLVKILSTESLQRAEDRLEYIRNSKQIISKSLVKNFISFCPNYFFFESYKVSAKLRREICESYKQSKSLFIPSDLLDAIHNIENFKKTGKYDHTARIRIDTGRRSCLYLENIKDKFDLNDTIFEVSFRHILEGKEGRHYHYPEYDVADIFYYFANLYFEQRVIPNKVFTKDQINDFKILIYNHLISFFPQIKNIIDQIFNEHTNPNEPNSQ